MDKFRSRAFSDNRFKQHYNFSALGRAVKNKTSESGGLMYWARLRAYLLISLQLIRLFIRSPKSVGIPRLKERLNRDVEWFEQSEKLLQGQKKISSLNLETNKKLIHGLENGRLHRRFLYPLLTAVLKNNTISIGNRNLGPFQASIQRYIIRALIHFKNLSALNSMVGLQFQEQRYIKNKTISVTYYPSLYRGEESLRFKPGVALIKGFIIRKKVWYKTRQFLL